MTKLLANATHWGKRSGCHGLRLTLYERGASEKFPKGELSYLNQANIIQKSIRL